MFFLYICASNRTKIMIQRILQQQIESNLDKQKVSILLGARRVGKTKMLQSIYATRKETAL
jgi:predicted AAA+ superfamily ATPase